MMIRAAILNYGFLVRQLVTTVALACAAPVPLTAQTVVGQITQTTDGMLLPGVLVSLADQAGTVVVSRLTDAGGMFVLRAPAAGRYDLHAELIGHESAIVRSLLLVADSTHRRDIAMAVHAIDLEAITVSVENRCRNGPPAAPGTHELWQAARTALRVTQWTQEQGAVRFRLQRTRRSLDASTLEVNAETSETRSGDFAGSPYVALSPERLAQDGFVTRASDGALEYWAPDATVLLSESFLANHCFRVASSVAAEPTLVGLEFEPVSGREIPEIEGVLWIEAVTSELRRLDFTYVNLPFGVRQRWDAVGGRVEFERLPNGMWIVRRWRIRMPIVAVRRPVAGAASTRELVLSELHELSGEIIAVNGVNISGTGLNGASATSRQNLAPDGRQMDTAAVPRTDSLTQVGATAARQPSARASTPVEVQTSQQQLGNAAAERTGIVGTVLSEMGPTPGVLITLLDSSGASVASTVTNDRGLFALEHPGGEGGYEIVAEHVAFAPLRMSVALGAHEALTLEVRLATRALPLGEIRVTARRQDFLADVGFYGRMERGLGWFVDAEEIDRRKPSRVTDLLRGASGIQVVSQGPFDADVRLFDSQRLTGDCPPTIYVDRHMVRRSPRAEPPLTQIVDISSVAALEVLRRPAEIPPEYRGANSACGVVLIWLKR